MKIIKNNKSLITIIVIIIVILGLGGIYLAQSKNINIGSSSTVSTEKTKEISSATSTKDIISVIRSGKQLQCNFNYADETSSTAGVFYIDGKNMRGEVVSRTDSEGEEYDFFTIRKGNETYIWGSAYPQDMGIKTEIEFDKFISDEQFSKYFSDEKAMYECQIWEVDPEAFIQPPTVKFISPSEMIQEIQNNP